MKKLISLILIVSFLFCVFAASSFAQEEIQTQAKSLILIEAETGRVLYELNADEALPPASVTKIMTLLLVMEALDDGKFALDDMVPVSSRAAAMGGSQVYLEPGEQLSVEEMLKCVVIASANDAAAALAEFVCGSLESFVTKMNERAAQLGMEHTHFENTNGLDDTTSEHLTSARDIAIMSSELLKHAKILDYTGIWMDSIRDGAFGLTNTNRLIRFYKGANGLKTGSTAKAGFCISATAKRDGMQLIAVVMGSPTRDERNQTAAKLLDYGFANYEVYSYDGAQLSLPVKGGKEESARLSADAQLFVLNKGEGKKVNINLELPEYLSAPLPARTVVGHAQLTLDGKELGNIEIKLDNEVERVGFWDLFERLFSSFTLF